MLVATGGGGLIGGIAAWYAGRVEVVSVEPEGCPALHDALAAGHPVPAPVGGIAADSLGAQQVGAFDVPDRQRACKACRAGPGRGDPRRPAPALGQLRLIAEPGGATALAALLSGAFVPPSGAKVGVVLCGANTDPATIAHG